MAFKTDLGRSTLRGVKKCPKCSQYNGTRATFCKNKSCKNLLNNNCGKVQSPPNAVKLITDTTDGIYSVRVRNMGPDYRNFVTISNIDNPDKNVSHSAHCFVDNCIIDEQTLLCNHVSAAVKTLAKSELLIVEPQALNMYVLPVEVVNNIEELTKQFGNSLVQRVSTCSFVVRCGFTDEHPTGYLHVKFFINKIKDTVDSGYFCPCKDFKFKKICEAVLCVHVLLCIAAFLTSSKLAEEFNTLINLIQTHCNKSLNLSVNENHIIEISDTNHEHGLLELNDSELEIDQSNLRINDSGLMEFDGPLQLKLNDNIKLSDQTNLVTIGNKDIKIEINDHFTHLEFSEDMKTSFDDMLQVEILSDDNAFLGFEPDQVNICDADSLDFSSKTVDQCNFEVIPSKRKSTVRNNKNIKQKKKCDNKKEELMALGVEDTFKSYEAAKVKKDGISKGNNCFKIIAVKNYNNPDPTKNPPSIQEATSRTKLMSVDFTEWLASVTESINESMQYAGNGKPDPLTFRIHKKYFHCLKERFTINKKKRLPNSISKVTRIYFGQAGEITRHRYIFTSVLQIQKIFHSTQVPLEITRSFVQNQNGTYSLCTLDQKEEILNNNKLDKSKIKIKPIERKTYLKVGSLSANKNDVTPFYLEWFPDVLPKSQVGELKIYFQYGHLYNGQPVPPPSNK